MKLEFGCGYGGLPGGGGHHPRDRGGWLAKHGDENTIAFDIDPEAVAYTEKMYGDKGIKFLVADGMKMPFEDGMFDLVHERGILHHLSDPNVAIAEIARVTRSGGTLDLYEIVDDDLVYAALRRLGGKWRGCKITSFFKSDDVLRLVSRYFRIVRVDYYWHLWVMDIPLYFWNKYPGWVAGLYVQYYISRLFNMVGLGKRMCSQMTAVCIRK